MKVELTSAFLSDSDEIEPNWEARDEACGPQMGTAAGFARHSRAGQSACEACKRGAAAKQRRLNRIRQRALTRLREAHPEEYAAYLAEERQREGLE